MNSSQTFMHFVGIDAGMVRCTICAKNVKYGTNGVRSLEKKTLHMKSTCKSIDRTHQ